MSQKEVFEALQTLGGKASFDDIVAQLKKSGKEGHRVKVRDSLIRLKNKSCVKDDRGTWIVTGNFE